MEKAKGDTATMRYTCICGGAIQMTAKPSSNYLYGYYYCRRCFSEFQFSFPLICTSNLGTFPRAPDETKAMPELGDHATAHLTFREGGYGKTGSVEIKKQPKRDTLDPLPCCYMYPNGTFCNASAKSRYEEMSKGFPWVVLCDKHFGVVTSSYGGKKGGKR